MTMKMWISLVTFSWSAGACHAQGDADEVGDGGADDGASEQTEQDRKACSDVWKELLPGGCPAGTAPRVQIGDPVTVLPLEDVAISLCDGMGYLIESDAVGAQEWVGHEILQNSVCTVGCVVAYCQPGQDTCLGGPLDRACGAYCGHAIEEQSCREFALGCSGIEPGDAGEGEDACGGAGSGATRPRAGAERT